MTNEEIVTAIQNGNADCIPELWYQIEHFVIWYAEKYLSGYPEHIQALKEDCVNQSFFAMLRAVKGYDPQYGKFTTYMKRGLVNSFNEVIYSGRSEKQQRDPMNNAASLDEPLTTADGLEVTLSDFIADKEIGEQTCYVIPLEISEMENEDQRRSINEFLKKGLSRSDNAGSKILSYMLDNNCRYAEAVQALYGSDTDSLRWQKNAAQTRLKQYIVSKPKEAQKCGIDEIITQGGLRQYSLNRFRDRAFTSGVEQIVIDRASRLN